jgi:drug/metabolite transporter (DMT)-like permease
MFLIILMYSLFAASFTIAKILLSFMPPILLIAVRMSIAGVVLLAMHAIHTKKLIPSLQTQSRIQSKLFFYHAAWWMVFAAVHICIPYVTEFIALESIAPSSSALIYNLTPFFSALFSYWYFGELMTAQKWLGFLIGFSGIAWFVCSQSIWSVHLNFAYILVLISVISGALGWIYVRKLVRVGYQPLLINGTAMLLGGLQSFVLAYLFEPHVTFVWSNLTQFSAWLALIILLTNVIYYNMYALLLKRYSATLLSFMGCVIPLFTACFDWLLLDVSVPHHFFVCLLVACVGVYIFYQEELRQGYIKA